MSTITQAPSIGAQFLDDLRALPDMFESAFALLSAPQKLQPETPPGAAADAREPDNNLDRGPSSSGEQFEAMACALAAYNTTRPLFAWVAGGPGRYTKNPLLEAGLRTAGGAIGQALGEWSCNQSLGNGGRAGKQSALMAGAASGLEFVFHGGTKATNVAKDKDEASTLLNTLRDWEKSPAAPLHRPMPNAPIPASPGWVSALENYAPGGFLGSVGVVLVASKEFEIGRQAEHNQAVKQLSEAAANPDADLNGVFAEVRDGETLNRVVEKLRDDALSEPVHAAAFRARLNPHEQARFDLSVKTLETVGVDGHLKKRE